MSSSSVDYNKIIGEMRTRKSKRYNIIISGVRSTGGTDDNTLVQSILDKLNIAATVASYVSTYTNQINFNSPTTIVGIFFQRYYLF